MFDVLIRDGLLVDGSGAPGRRADVAVRDGRIAEIGAIAATASARQTIDAAGRIVCPGFIDVHTHYDAQVFWDTSVSPSLYHGVTTIVGGNCGFSIAPLSPDAGDYLMRMLARVEGMPLESLREGVPWDWSSFGEYLGKLDGQLAVNAGFLVGHSALRRVVMGERAVGHEASPEELEAMNALLRAALSEGGLGFSSTRSAAHNDANGQPVPSRHASLEELYSLCRTTRDFPGTSLEMLPGTSTFSEEDKEILTQMSLSANRPLNWNLIAPRADMPEVMENQLGASDYAAERGAVVLALTVPQELKGRVNLLSGFAFDALPRWAEVIALPVEERKKALSDPAVREQLRIGGEEQGAGPLKALTRWADIGIEETFEAGNERWRGRRVGEIAAERGIDPLDALLDLALSEGLRTSFSSPTEGQTDPESWRMRANSWTDPRTIVGASDAGAHLDMLDTFAFTTQLLGRGMREMGLISVEDAVHQLSDVPARLYGMKQRGRLEEGWHADLVVFDVERVGKGPTYTRFDLPAGAPRLYADAEGVDHVFVNGVEIVREGEQTGARPGTVLRSGRDTETVEVPGGASAC
ncbi:MAG: amidohydrolase family protein [Deltaproteobacteria bacterium]|jgi:N-acyl-D-aspartate/D-glutamate deacylase|nr:amidohydrolase family protein [Deltaproteobacteria bacterium]MBW2497985.1 amidohydrolase family protein [Deltaproteobacteria bacterium]